jgi:hypothetical protein
MLYTIGELLAELAVIVATKPTSWFSVTLRLVGMAPKVGGVRPELADTVTDNGTVEDRTGLPYKIINHKLILDVKIIGNLNNLLFSESLGFGIWFNVKLTYNIKNLYWWQGVITSSSCI